MRLMAACMCVVALALFLSACSQPVIADSVGAVDPHVVPVGNVRAGSDGPVYVMTELVVYREAALDNEENGPSSSRWNSGSTSASSSLSASSASSGSTSASSASSGSTSASSSSSGSSSLSGSASASSSAGVADPPVEPDAPAVRSLSSSIYGSVEYALDAFGNPVSCRSQGIDPFLEGRVGSKLDQPDCAVSTFEFDKAEWGLDYKQTTVDYSQPFSLFGKSGSNSAKSYGVTTNKTVSFEIDGGKPISRALVFSNARFDYYASGKMKMLSFPESVTSSNLLSRSNDYCTFDEAGYPISSQGFNSGTSFLGNSVNYSKWNYQWSFDDEGKPESVRLYAGRVGNIVHELTYTLEADDAGNITHVYSENGELCARMAYKKIDNPSAWVRLYVAGVLQWC